MNMFNWAWNDSNIYEHFSVDLYNPQFDLTSVWVKM